MSHCVSDNRLPICLTQPHHAVVGISDRSPQSLATNSRVCGLTSKQWKPMRSYVPATHERDDVAPRSRSCAPGLNPFSATRRDSGHQNKVKVKGLCRNSSYLTGFSKALGLNLCARFRSSNTALRKYTHRQYLVPPGLTWAEKGMGTLYTSIPGL